MSRGFAISGGLQCNKLSGQGYAIILSERCLSSLRRYFRRVLWRMWGSWKTSCLYVIPLSYHYDKDTPEKIYLHGSIRSRAMEVLARGAPVCVTVTLTDGLVYSRKAMNHSMNYRSVVLFGKGREVMDEDEKFGLFDAMVQRYFPGRKVSSDYNAPPPADLGVTALVAVAIEEWSGKRRIGSPTGPDDDADALGSAGVLDLREV